VGSLVRLRIELANTPGSLAHVAAVIGGYGGNIRAIDVQDASGEWAVDEMTVAFDASINLAEVRREIGKSGRARLLSYQTASAVDPMVRMLQRLSQSLTYSPDVRDETLRRAVAELFATPAVWMLSPAEASTYAAARMAMAEPGVAIALETEEALPALGETISGRAALLAVTSGQGDGHIDGMAVLLVARPSTQGFTPTEMTRAEALVALYDALNAMKSQAAVAH